MSPPLIYNMRSFADLCGIDEFAYVPTFGHTAGVLVSSDLFHRKNNTSSWWQGVSSTLTGDLFVGR